MSLSNTQCDAIVELHNAMRSYDFVPGMKWYTESDFNSFRSPADDRVDAAQELVSSELGVTLEAIREACDYLFFSPKYNAALSNDDSEALRMLVERLEQIATK